MFLDKCLDVFENGWNCLGSFGTILGVVWDIVGTFLDLFGKCLGSFGNIFGTILGTNLKQLTRFVFYHLKTISVPEIFFN